MEHVTAFAQGTFPYAAEFQVIGMALQGAVAVRSGPNRHQTLHWFHAFVLSSMVAFAGGMLGFIWMAKPTSMLSNDLNIAACILAFVIVNCLPFGVGYTFCDALPVKVIITSAAQLFRGVGMMKFINACYEAFKDNPSKYYPTPLFGPIMNGILLGNMGGFLMKGFEGHIRQGVPWPVQNGLFCATFYHLFAHDTEGPLGQLLRSMIPAQELFGITDQQFAACVVTYFMQIMGILQLPEFLGPSFTPFGPKILSPWKDSSTWTLGKALTSSSSSSSSSSSTTIRSNNTATTTTTKSSEPDATDEGDENGETGTDQPTTSKQQKKKIKKKKKKQS